MNKHNDNFSIERWCKNGVLHRDGGPAYKGIDGLEVWAKNGKLHRLDGPAVTHPNGSNQWWRNGEYLY